MEQKRNLFKEGLLAEAKQYTGEIIELFYEGPSMIGEEEVTVALDLEKKLITLFRLRVNEAGELSKKITGVDIRNLKTSELDKFADSLADKATEEEGKHLAMLRIEGDGFRELFWESVTERLTEDQKLLRLELRPGWKVVAGISPLQLLSKIFKENGIASNIKVVVIR